MSLPWVKPSMEVWRMQLLSQSAYLGVDSSDGSVVMHVVVHMTSRAFLFCWTWGQNLALR